MIRLSHDIVTHSDGRRIALVVLPGAAMCAQDFRDRGFLQELEHNGKGVDVVLVDIDAGDYASVAFSHQLQQLVFDLLRKQGYRRIWLLGISLGAFGAMRVLQSGLEAIEGFVLLSPFLATRGTVSSILKTGGLDGWSPGPDECLGDELSLLCWLKKHFHEGKIAKTYLGWGESDRYRDAGALLAKRLADNRVFRVQGDHDWPTWSRLWRDILAACPFEVHDANPSGGMS